MQYLLEIGVHERFIGEDHHSGKGVGSALQTYLTSADADSARFVKDYAKRVLSRVTDDSDDEVADPWA